MLHGRTLNQKLKIDCGGKRASLLMAASLPPFFQVTRSTLEQMFDVPGIAYCLAASSSMVS
jgi:hypothetical protein